VHAGQSPVSGSAVALYQVGSGSSAAALGSATSDANGRFTLSGYACPTPTTQIYLIARGGNPGLGSGTNNSALHELLALGDCGSSPASVNIDELTTVAAAYALQVFTDPANPDNVRASAGNALGLGSAMRTANRLADAVSGHSGTAFSATGCGAASTVNCDPQQRLATLANSLVACSGASSSPLCSELLACATPGATFGGGTCTAGPSAARPADSLQAVLAIARNAGTVSMAGIYDVATRNAVFAPALAAAPNDWTLALNFTNVGLSSPTALSLDAAGNVWVANYNDRVVKLAPDGSALSPPGGYTGGRLHESFGLAIDAANHVWVANEESPGVNSGSGTITELAADGTILSGASGYSGGGLDFPQSVDIDSSGNVWITNAGNASITELSSAGVPLSPATGYTGGGVSYPVKLAFDLAGDVWVANQAADAVSKLGPSGDALSPAGGYTGGGLDVPQGVAVDAHGNAWVSNYYGNSITALSSSGAPLSATAYGGGGLMRPGDVEIDGAGRIWVADYLGNAVSELQGADDTSPGTPLSPAAGFSAGNLLQPFALAIDASGNVWVSNFGNASVTELIGAAAPVGMPRIGVPVSP